MFSKRGAGEFRFSPWSLCENKLMNKRSDQHKPFLQKSGLFNKLQNKRIPGRHTASGDSLIMKDYSSMLLALASRYCSASGLHRPLLAAQSSASFAYIGSVSPSLAKSSIAVSGMEM